MYQQSVKDKSPSEIAEDNAKDIADTAKSVAADAEGAAKKAVN